MSKGSGSAGRAGVSATTGNGKNVEVERLGGNVEIRYKNTVQQVRGSDQRGLQLQSQYYAELYKNGERIAWTSAESGGKDLFEEKINSWRSEYSKEKASLTSSIKSAARELNSQGRRYRSVSDFREALVQKIGTNNIDTFTSETITVNSGTTYKIRRNKAGMGYVVEKV